MVSSFEFAANVVGIMIDSDLDEDLAKSLQNKIERKLKVHDKINLFFEIKCGNRISFNAFINQMMFNFDHIGKFKKIAVVTDLGWLKNSMILKDVFVPGKIETFSNKERLEALAWIAQ